MSAPVRHEPAAPPTPAERRAVAAAKRTAGEDFGRGEMLEGWDDAGEHERLALIEAAERALVDGALDAEVIEGWSAVVWALTRSERQRVESEGMCWSPVLDALWSSPGLLATYYADSDCRDDEVPPPIAGLVGALWRWAEEAAPDEVEGLLAFEAHDVQLVAVYTHPRIDARIGRRMLDRVGDSAGRALAAYHTADAMADRGLDRAVEALADVADALTESGLDVLLEREELPAGACLRLAESRHGRPALWADLAARCSRDSPRAVGELLAIDGMDAVAEVWEHLPHAYDWSNLTEHLRREELGIGIRRTLARRAMGRHPRKVLALSEHHPERMGPVMDEVALLRPLLTHDDPELRQRALRVVGREGRGDEPGRASTVKGPDDDDPSLRSTPRR